MKEKIAVFSAILLGTIVGLLATVSLIIDAFVIDNLTGTIIDLLVMGFAYMTAWIGTRYMTMEKVAKDKLDMEWDYKIKPVVNLMRDTIGRVNVLETEVMANNRSVSTTLDYVSKMQDMDVSSVYIYPGVSFKFIVKVLILTVFTFSSLVYAAEYPIGIIHYFILVVYLAWWGLITSEYKLYDNKNAWTWALIIILFIPATGMILDALIGVNSMVGILFFLMLIYVYSYYSWAAYITIGFELIDIGRVKNYVIKYSKDLFQTEKIQAKMPTIDVKWVDYAIFACVTVAGVIGVWLFI